MKTPVVSGEFDPPGSRSPFEVLRVFLKLGLISFGGPIAHLGYFREEFVTRRRWLDDVTYTDLVALCQFLPGPASSQAGFSIGLMRAGYLGGLAAWTGFTLPSTIALVLFAYGVHALAGPVGMGLLHGLKLVSVAIVAQAVLGMARTLCPDRRRATIAALAMILILYGSSSITQIGAILLGGVAGLLVCRTPAPLLLHPMPIPVSRRVGVASLTHSFSCWSVFRCCSVSTRTPAWPCSMPSIGRVHWCLAADTSCCPCCGMPL